MDSTAKESAYPKASDPGARAEGASSMPALAAEVARRKETERALRASLHDLRALAQRERLASQRMADLQSATARLASAFTLSEVAEVLLSVGAVVPGASASVIYFIDDETGQMRLAGSRHLEPAIVQQRQVLALDAPVPLATALRTRTPIWIETWAELVAAYPNLAAHPVSKSAVQAVVALPLVHAGQLVGGFALGFETPCRFDDDERQWLQNIASQTALAAERARLYQAERRARDEAETLAARLAETVRFNELLSGMLAHDLRNPLGAVMGAAELVLLRHARGEPVVDLVRPVERILASGRRMARMVNQMLDVSRIRLGGGLHLERRPVDLLSLVRQVMDELDQRHVDERLTLEHQGNTMGVWDADGLGQVFSNLVGNAIEHGQQRGVLVRIDGVDAKEARVTVWNQGSIPSELLPRLFEPFTGSDRRRVRGQGLGLGLYIAKQITGAHGGRIEVDSSDGKGTCFTVVLPRA